MVSLASLPSSIRIIVRLLLISPPPRPAEPGGIRRGQRCAALQARHRLEKAHNPVGTQHQLVGLARIRDALRQLIPPQRDAVEGQRTDDLIERDPRNCHGPQAAPDGCAHPRYPAYPASNRGERSHANIEPKIRERFPVSLDAAVDKSCSALMVSDVVVFRAANPRTSPGANRKQGRLSALPPLTNSLCDRGRRHRRSAGMQYLPDAPLRSLGSASLTARSLY